MDSSDERDYSEEAYNQRLLDECPDCGNTREGCECDDADICDGCGDYHYLCSCADDEDEED